MIERFRVQNYKALRDVTLELTPIHVLIGPNDSGKTSILEAIAALCRSVDHELAGAFTGSWKGSELVWRANWDGVVSLEAEIENGQQRFSYRLACRFSPNERRPVVEDERVEFPSDSRTADFANFSSGIHDASGVFFVIDHPGLMSSDAQAGARCAYDALVGAHFYRWNPRMLALPTAPDAKRRYRMDPSGFGLALCLDDILGYDRDRFIALERRFTNIFPHIKSILLKPGAAFRAPTDDPEAIPMLQRADGKGLYFKFAASGQEVSAAQVSDGVLLVLAYLTVLYLPEPPRVLLVEEPENGVHPKRLQDVLKILRELVEEQTHTQVILTTHSPYVVDLFAPEEVSLCHMEEDGSVSVRRLSESETVRQQLKVFTLGEIWTAEGDEAIARSTPAQEEPQP